MRKKKYNKNNKKRRKLNIFVNYKYWHVVKHPSLSQILFFTDLHNSTVTKEQVVDLETRNEQNSRHYYRTVQSAFSKRPTQMRPAADFT